MYQRLRHVLSNEGSVRSRSIMRGKSVLLLCFHSHVKQKQCNVWMNTEFHATVRAVAEMSDTRNLRIKHAADILRVTSKVARQMNL